MSWQQMKKAKSEKGSSAFIVLKDGESIEGVFRGEPHCFYSIFKDPKGSNIEYKTKVPGSQFKFKINFIVKEPSGLVSRILQGSKTLSDQIVDMTDEVGLDYWFKIKRTGSTKDDTRYTIIPKGPVGDLLPSINKVNLLSLEPKGKSEFKPTDDLPPFDDSEDIPF